MDTHKMQTTNVRGFTLVELIVVITILVILGTIAFLNLGSFSSSARDGQRTSDLNQISKQISVIQAKNGTSFVAMASGTTANTLTGKNLAGTGIIFLTGANGSYIGGDVNYGVLGVDSTKMIDPTMNAKYKIGATTLLGGTYEVAARLEETAKALVMGTFRSRSTMGSGTIVGTGANTVSLSSNDIGKFYVGDIVYASGTSVYTGTITKISFNASNGVDLTLGTTTVTSTGILSLVGGMGNEVVGLVRGTGTTVAVSNNSTTELPY